MLKFININNWGIIKESKMCLGSGLNAITGETGSGKSLIMNALSFSLGHLPIAKSPMSSDNNTIVEVQFDISRLGLESYFETHGLIHESHTIIRREIIKGRSRCFINDSPVTISVLKNVTSRLINVHSQFDSHKISKQSFQLDILDSYSSRPQIKDNYRDCYRKYTSLKNAYDELIDIYSSRTHDREYIEFQISELSEYDLQSIDQELLEQRVQNFENSLQVRHSIKTILDHLRDGDNSVISLLKSASTYANDVDNNTSTSTKCVERIESSIIDLDDLCLYLDQEGEGPLVSSQEIEGARQVLDFVYRLYSKHNVSSVEDLMKLKAELTNSLITIDNFQSKLTAMKTELEVIYKRLIKVGEELSRSRRMVKTELSNKMIEILSSLNMKNVQFDIEFSSIPPQLHGTDKVSFLFNSNKGNKLTEIASSASGGEISRIVFCLNYLTAGKSHCPVLVYDEADNGISGETANQMGNMMNKIASEHQVIVITHLPQIASKANVHFSISKSNDHDRTYSMVNKLNDDQRILEIAQMISGKNITSTTIENAKELMRSPDPSM